MHEGHRQRMRERYIEGGLVDFAPHEVLELLLYYCAPRRDVNPLAHDLINTFGSLHGVFQATPDQLMQVKGIGENAAVFLSMIPGITKCYQQSLTGEKPVIKNRQDAENYCRSLFIGLNTEHFYLVALDAGMRVIGKHLVAKGSLTQVPAYPRVLTQAALTLNAHCVILCHNHPGGSCEPSDSDVILTDQLGRILNAIDVELLDHLIVTDNTVLSMNRAGYLAKDCSTMLPAAADSSNSRLHHMIKKENAPL